LCVGGEQNAKFSEVATGAVICHIIFKKNTQCVYIDKTVAFWKGQVTEAEVYRLIIQVDIQR
jgi:hypothetical protein